MNITIIAVGKIKERYISDGIGEFLKRLRPYADVEIKEAADEKAPENLSPKEEDQVRGREADRIIRFIKPGQVVIALDIEGAAVSSEQLAGMVREWGLAGKSDLCFIIGGSLGLHRSVTDRADLRLSFGRMTFPHQLMRLILLEQIYRAFKINRGEPYHK
ncbi:MAG: 23S rRNA (pseudouridine(1915)-N(3))-methyltransferase RlmH [Firmicutes bacterium HGW-Firmicutes-14]|nr:MAG: 23S rRNA (pseudouridine(1915)-N(3))-methyltransferase RlmH [Firmicutes bacterium HGW-Firmicutes-14]